MRIITTRRISQIFFFSLFLWFCVVATLGQRWWQLRGWPVNWLLQLDPLHAIGVMLSTHTIYAGLIWAVATLSLTMFLGRFFCGWLCPFGALQQFVGYLGKRGLKASEKITRNQSHWGRRIKYWILLFMLAAAAADMLHFAFGSPGRMPVIFGIIAVSLILVTLLLRRYKIVRMKGFNVLAVIMVFIVGMLLELAFPQSHWVTSSLQTGLLDPIALMHRSVNLVLLPLIDHPLQLFSSVSRTYPGALSIGIFFLVFTLLSLRIPRFYCRFVCPLGALFGLLSGWYAWRIGRKALSCNNCLKCEQDCEGACAPASAFLTGECLLCLNCLDQCRHNALDYTLVPSTTGESVPPDLSRRQAVTAIATGLAAAPILRLEGFTANHWNPGVISPPGALAEADFLSRCIKCGQCMRVCPTNVIHPAGWQNGFEGLWTPMLNFRVGSSGCQYNCVACSQICPTAALRPLTTEARMGRGAYAKDGPIRIGMAFVDQGRCLPWAMDTPCIVCQENCPVSPKAIFTREALHPVRNGRQTPKTLEKDRVVLAIPAMVPGRYETGDYFCRVGQSTPRRIAANSSETIDLDPATTWSAIHGPGDTVEILIRLQRPFVDPRQCIGCGVCEHECPVQGKRAIRVSAENESRQRGHKLVIG